MDSEFHLSMMESFDREDVEAEDIIHLESEAENMPLAWRDVETKYKTMVRPRTCITYPLRLETRDYSVCSTMYDNITLFIELYNL